LTLFLVKSRQEEQKVMTCSGGEDGEGPPYTRMGDGGHSEDQPPTSLTQGRVGEDNSYLHKMRLEDGPVYHQMREEMTRSPVYQKSRPPSRALILTTGLLSVLLSLGVLLPSVLLLVNSSYWHSLHSALEGWLERHPWDRKVTRVVWGSVAWLDRHHESLLGSILLSWLIHLTFSFLLIAGAVRHRRDLFLPWLCSDMVILVLMVATFTFTCFLSFFVDLLVAIVFPVVAGLVLGVWSLLWHRVRAAYLAMGVGGNPEDPWNSQNRMMMGRKTLRSRMVAVLQWWRHCGSGSGPRH